MVEVTCDICSKPLPEYHIEVFVYTVDEDDEDIEHGYDLCSPDCHLTLALNLGKKVGVV